MLTGKCLLPKTAIAIARRSSKAVTSDDDAEGNSHAVACSPESNGGGLACGQRMREGGSLTWSQVLDSDGLDPTAEECVLLLQAVERGVQLRDNCVRLGQRRRSVRH
jgi:hypothetical protein